MEQSKEPRNKPTPLYLTEEAKIFNGVKTVYWINGVGKIGQIRAEK